MKYFLIAVLLAVSIYGCASGSKVKREPPAPLVNFSADKQVKELWSASIGTSGKKDDVKLMPYLDNNVLYTSDTQGRVSAFAADSGRRLWETELRVAVTGAAGGGEGVVVVGTKKGRVIALDMTNGKRLWTQNVSSEILAPAAVGSSVVVVQSIDGNLFGLSVTDGKRRWVYNRSEPALSLRGTSAPVIVDQYVLAGFASGKIAVIRLRDGRLVWEFAVSLPRGRNEIERLVDVDVTPLIIGDTLYAAGYQGKIVAVNLRSGRLLWSRDVSTYSGMSADRTNIYLSDEKGHIIALNQRTGSSVWKQDKLRGRSLNAPTYYNGYIAVGDYEGYVHWLSREDGHFVARRNVGGGAIRAQAVAGSDALYVASQGGTLFALRIVDK
ncbi:MAG: outer membrane protein assembly factor BamB [Gammaproteobacteria bacterium]|nr:MAG: outer membrane protein assembly factor BamB [Gammaproteobacteria bacterium]